jgi:integrase
MRVKLTPAFVSKAAFVPNSDGKPLKDPSAARTIYWDQNLRGFGLAVTAGGHKSYICQYRAGGQSRRMIFKSVLNLEDARKEAKAVLGAVAKGRDPLDERRKAEASAENTLKSVVENYLAREGGNLRTLEDRRAAFARLVYPNLGTRQIGEIKRSEISKLLDTIESENGPRMATLTLAYLRRVMNWHATRVDDFRSPIVRGMARGAANKRDRVLTADELRAFWRASNGWDHPFSHMLRFILFTAVRRDEAADMHWSEIEGDLWTIPAARYKTNIDFELPLSQAARDVLDATTKLGKIGFVFTTNGKTALSGFDKFKKTFDSKMLAELRKLATERGDDPDKVNLPRWTIHDLRRTARSLMTQAGIGPDHAERALGHVIVGVRGVYDRHSYQDEKRRAFDALAVQVGRILNPQPNVVPMRRGVAGC